MRLPGRMQMINESLATKQILSAIDRGVNYFDTAVPYHGGKSEPFFGKMLEQNRCRDKVKIATKLPHWATPTGQDMDEMLDKQLKNLRTDRIDYYLIHGVNGQMWSDAVHNGVIPFLEGALASGKIINAGFSFHGLASEFNDIVDAFDWTFCQIQYNYLDRENQAGTAGLEYAASRDLAVVIMEPLRGGNLSKSPPPTVRSIWNRADNKRTPAEWSLRWIWNRPEVTVILSGMNDDAHIDENIRIASVAEPNSLTKAELALVDEATDEFRRVMKVGCTACQYCMPCPAGVNIPACFEAYNSHHVFKDKLARRLMGKM